jgi:hypothetical protein
MDLWEQHDIRLRRPLEWIGSYITRIYKFVKTIAAIADVAVGHKHGN